MTPPIDHATPRLVTGILAAAALALGVATIVLQSGERLRVMALVVVALSAILLFTALANFDWTPLFPRA